MDYVKAVALLKGRQSKKVANNTWLKTRDGGEIGLQLHTTDVVTFHPDGSVSLNSGEWRTVTTKDRINEFQELARVSQERGLWFVTVGPNPWKKEGRVPFADGMKVYPDGRIEGAGKDPRAELKLREQVREYAAGFVKALTAGKVRPPSQGDCWFCALETDKGASLGDAFKDTDHLISHMREKYYVGSLLVRVAKEGGMSPAARSIVGKRLGYCEESWPEDEGLLGQIRGAIANYMGRRLGLTGFRNG